MAKANKDATPDVEPEVKTHEVVSLYPFAEVTLLQEYKITKEQDGRIIETKEPGLRIKFKKNKATVTDGQLKMLRENPKYGREYWLRSEFDAIEKQDKGRYEKLLAVLDRKRDLAHLETVTKKTATF